MKKQATTIDMQEQIQSAFSFIQKLYNESSYLIKEIEGQLSETTPRFKIIKPSGYSISARNSTGLEPNNVNFWLLRKFAVAFVEDSDTPDKGGQTFTEINGNLKVLYFRLILDQQEVIGPQIMYGVIFNIEKQKKESWVKKFENLMSHFENNEYKIFSDVSKISYKDGVIRISKKLKTSNLLDINSSEELMTKVIEPALKLYHSVKNK
jgi:hypothetical protein